MTSFLERLTGPIDEPTTQQSGRGFLDQLTGPTDGSATPAHKKVEVEEAAPHRRRNFLEALTGATDGSEEVDPSPSSKPKKDQPSGFDIVGAVGAVFVGAVDNFKKAEKIKNAPPKAPVTSAPAQTTREVIPYDLWKKGQLEAIAAIAHWPRSSFYDHPYLQQLRSVVFRAPRHRQLQVATEIMNRLKQQQVMREGMELKIKAAKENQALLAREPLTTAGWNGYEQWRERVHEARLRREDTKDGFWRYVGRQVRNAAVQYARRAIDNALATKGPEVKRTGGRVTIQLPDSHLDDQVVFDGRMLTLINPTSPQDIRKYECPQIESSVEFSVEGAGILQGMSALRTAATGSKDPMLLLRRGSFVVKAKGRDEELVRVPMVDPVGFLRALTEAIATCKPGPALPGDPGSVVMPGSVRDLLQYRLDDELERWKEDQREKPQRTRPHESETTPEWPADSGTGFQTEPSTSDVSEELNRLRREVAELRRRMGKPELPSGQAGGDEGDIVDGEFREI